MIVGGTTFPLAVPATGGTLAPAADPVAAKMLPFYRAVLRQYLSAAMVAAMPGQVVSACEGVSAADVGEYLDKLVPRLPLLAMYPVRANASRQDTLELFADTLVYKLDYHLPVLTADQAERVLPVLVAARKLLVAATYAQGDAGVSGSADILGQAGVVELRVGRSEFTKLGELASRVPVLSIEIEADVQGQLSFPEAELTAIKASLDVGAEADGLLFTNLVQVQTP